MNRRVLRLAEEVNQEVTCFKALLTDEAPTQKLIEVAVRVTKKAKHLEDAMQTMLERPNSLAFRQASVLIKKGWFVSEYDYALSRGRLCNKGGTEYLIQPNASYTCAKIVPLNGAPSFPSGPWLKWPIINYLIDLTEEKEPVPKGIVPVE